VSQTDVIKLHKASGKVKFLGCDDFDGKALPQLRNRIKVNLRTRWVQVFDHSADGQLLFFKERFVASNHPRRAEMAAFSAKLRKLGLSDTLLMGPTKIRFAQMLEKAGLNDKLNKRRRVRSASSYALILTWVGVPFGLITLWSEFLCGFC
jgi:hypothetical protein